VKLIHHPRFQQLRSNDFIRHNGVFFFGNLVVSALNYLYYPVLGRLLLTAAFGEVQTLVSVFMQATIFLSVVTNIAVNVVANEPDTSRASRVVYELERVSLLIMLAGLGLAGLFVHQVASFLQFTDTLPFWLLAASLLLGVPSSLNTAYLRGRTAFGPVSISGALGSLAKLIASAAFVVAGFGTAGAIGGIVAAQAVTLVYTRAAARRRGLHASGRLWRRPELALIRPQLPYSALVLIVSLVITALFSLDIIVAKHYFPADVAGAYAGVSTIARIIFYLTGSISIVLLSSVKLDATPAANRRLLTRSFLLQGALGGCVLAIFTAVPGPVISLLIGSRYLAYAQLLPSLSLALFLLAAINLLFAYDLALRRWSAAVVAVVGAGCMALILQLHHASPGAVVQSVLLGSVALLALRGLDAVRRHYARPRPAGRPKLPTIQSL
jgi:O-antigen/teichoic acid export membrane protein